MRHPPIEHHAVGHERFASVGDAEADSMVEAGAPSLFRLHFVERIEVPTIDAHVGDSSDRGDEPSAVGAPLHHHDNIDA